MDEAGIHDEHPFATPREQRDPARRLRGRLAGPVAVFTAGSGRASTGLTVSSVLVSEGPPPRVLALINEATDLWEQIETSGRWVTHVLDESQRSLSDRFAGIRPSPGGLFAGLDIEASPYGPVLTAVGTRAVCRVEQMVPLGHHRLVVGLIDEIVLDDLDPLVYFRGRYRRLSAGESATTSSDG